MMADGAQTRGGKVGPVEWTVLTGPVSARPAVSSYIGPIGVETLQQFLFLPTRTPLETGAACARSVCELLSEADWLSREM